MSVLLTTELTRILNNMIIERKYAQDSCKTAVAKLDFEAVQYYKGKIAVYDLYIRTIEIQLERVK